MTPSDPAPTAETQPDLAARVAKWKQSHFDIVRLRSVLRHAFLSVQQGDETQKPFLKATLPSAAYAERMQAYLLDILRHAPTDEERADALTEWLAK